MIICHLDKEALLSRETMVFGGPEVGSEERFKVDFKINDPRGVIAYEAFEPGKVTKWAFWHDEVHVITHGTAEVTYTLPPNHNKTVTRTITAGDAYLILGGTRASFKVISDEPYLHVCVIMPRYEYAKWLLKEEY